MLVISLFGLSLPGAYIREDPGSATVFLFVVEVLEINIRNNDKIKGIKIDEHIEIKSGQFTDDTILFSLFQQESLQAIVDTLLHFQKNSGLHLNYDKSLVYRIG